MLPDAVMRSSDYSPVSASTEPTTPPSFKPEELPLEVILEKMQKGETVSGRLPQLLMPRLMAMQLAFQFNHTGTPTEAMQTLSTLMPNKHPTAIVLPPVQVDLGRNVHIGQHAYINYNCVFLDGATITIGDFSLIGPNCTLATPTHPIDPEVRRTGDQNYHSITIGNDVWVGASVTILGNVTIGHNSIIGAGSVVTKSIPANCIAFGSPCKVVKRLVKQGKTVVAVPPKA
eukprot:Protomagalhaensia_wolfi_Nauph_80__1860@NODE_2162_length_1190_cov_7265_008688_g1692_i0_p1_GENE_NODE_2162_length_1190_cov_7265_008688_g1692_i0NODE_2162_length_1190_cov_7265_008688_g1692_i0_p1_ORF_typecomplete_len230_score29_78Hexapep/PF00132_24/0_013Hexapep/PF00132_24/7_3e06Hexapep/PF00132_24/2_3e10Hexapep_2/PF14602_6/3_5e07Hexapep_2/PF14602_6/1_8e09_NODE_2162_length_1190_cov_7265_008688_g1692_i04061095